MSIESAWNALSVHGSPAAMPVSGILNEPSIALWSMIHRASVGTYTPA